MATNPFTFSPVEQPQDMSGVLTPQGTIPSLDLSASQQDMQAAVAAPRKSTTVPSPAVMGLDQATKNAGQTSTLSYILAILGAAKGDFRGLQAIEESKRRTKLGRAILPEMRKVDALTNKGDYRAASEYLNSIVGSFGPQADYLEPYFRQMSSRITDKEKRFESTNAMVNQLDRVTPKGHINRPIIDAWKEGLAKGELPSESAFENFLTRMGAHIQRIGPQITFSSPVTGETTTQAIREPYTTNQVNNIGGLLVTARNNITVNQLADLMNGLPVRTADGKTIMPNDETGRKIAAEYEAAGPINAQAELASRIPLDPAMAIQLTEQSGAYNTALRLFGKKDVDAAFREHYDRLTQQQIASRRGILEVDPTLQSQAGWVTIDTDPTSSRFLSEQPPSTVSEVKASGGRLSHIRQDINDNILIPARRAKGDLALIPKMFEGNQPTTRHGQLSQGINEYISSWLGYPVNEDVEVRQTARAILNSTIEQVANVIQYGRKEISGRDRADIADLKRYASGTFRTSEEYVKAADIVNKRLDEIIVRSIEGSLPRSGLRPTGAIQQTDERGRAMPYSTGPVTLPPEAEAVLQQRLREGGVQQPAPVQGQPLSAAERIKASSDAKAKAKAQQAEQAAREQKQREERARTAAEEKKRYDEEFAASEKRRRQEDLESMKRFQQRLFRNVPPQ